MNINRWRLFLSNILISPERATKAVLAACAVHNYLRTKLPTYTNSLLDRENEQHEFIPGAWRAECNLDDVDPLQGNHNRMCAKRQREELCDYVNGVGSVPWQDRMI